MCIVILLTARKRHRSKTWSKYLRVSGKFVCTEREDERLRDVILSAEPERHGVARELRSERDQVLGVGFEFDLDLLNAILFRCNAEMTSIVKISHCATTNEFGHFWYPCPGVCVRVCRQCNVPFNATMAVDFHLS